jgi:hypothetical protein
MAWSKEDVGGVYKAFMWEACLRPLPLRRLPLCEYSLCRCGHHAPSVINGTRWFPYARLAYRAHRAICPTFDHCDLPKAM